MGSFSGPGLDPLVVDFGTNGHDSATEVLPLPSGKLRMVGEARTQSGRRMVVTEIDPDAFHRSGFESP